RPIGLLVLLPLARRRVIDVNRTRGHRVAGETFDLRPRQILGGGPVGAPAGAHRDPVRYVGRDHITPAEASRATRWRELRRLTLPRIDGVDKGRAIDPRLH